MNQKNFRHDQLKLRKEGFYFDGAGKNLRAFLAQCGLYVDHVLSWSCGLRCPSIGYKSCLLLLFYLYGH